MNTVRQRLEKISLSGYKSIRKLEGLRLNQGLNVLIGANGSGKTNFVRFFELLGHMMDPSKGLQNYVSQRMGANAFLFRGAKLTPEFSAHLEFGSNEYEFTLRAADDGFSLFFAHESAPLQGPVYGRVVYGTGHRESELARKYPTGFKSESDAVEAVRGWRVHHFHDTSPNARVMGLINVVDNQALHDDAGNLAAFLLRISEQHPEHFARIQETIRQVAPFFGAFVLREVVPGRGQTQLLWKDRYSDLEYFPSQLSDGTLRYICLASLLLQPNPPATLIIDEPELGLHPMAIKLLASLLHEAASRGQIIVSTQSSLLLDEMTPEHVIVANHRDGETILERLDEAALEDWLAEYTLGQLWEKNTLGGNP
jgi:predicted ATPase